MYAPGVPQPHWALGDFDYNGFVDDDDVTLLGVFYDPSAAPLVAAVRATGVAAVPEPSTWVLLAAFSIIPAFVIASRQRLMPPPWLAHVVCEPEGQPYEACSTPPGLSRWSEVYKPERRFL